MLIIKRAVAAGIYLTMFSFSMLAHAEMDMTDAEFEILPDICKHKKWVSKNHPWTGSAADGESLLGKSYIHIHHHCWSLVYYQRSYAQGLSHQERRAMVADAINNWGYVLNNSEPDFAMAAEVYTYRGRAYLRNNDPKKAIEDFSRAISKNPKYWRPYYYWAFYLSTLGENSAALKLAQKGLENAPDTPALLSFVETLKGKKTPRVEK